MKRRQRCTVIGADGKSQCLNSARKGFLVCNVHQGLAAGQPINASNPGFATPKVKPVETPEDIIRTLLTDADSSVRLRAVDMWQKHFEHRERNKTDVSELIPHLTPDEREEVVFHLAGIHRIKEQIYARNPDLDVDDTTIMRRRAIEQRELQLRHVVVQPASAPVVVSGPVLGSSEPVDEDDFEVVSADDEP